MSATNTLYRTIVGPVEPLRRNSDVPTPYRQAVVPQMEMNGSEPVEPGEAEQPISEEPT